VSDTIVVIDPRLMDKLGSHVHDALNKHAPPAIGFILLAFEEQEDGTQQSCRSTDAKETIARLRQHADFLERQLQTAS
jgi:hypothetical protein